MKQKPFKPKHVLVTGGAGFIGANFIRFYLNADPVVQLVNLDKITYAGNNVNLENNQNRLTFVHGDICDSDLLLSLLRKHQIDAIINFAAESHVDRSIHEPLLFAKSNVLGTATLLEAARCYWLDELGLDTTQCKFYQISTDEVYGSLTFNDAPCTEDHLYKPRSPYSASKAGADHFVHAYYHTYGLPVVLSHCSNNYGPYQNSEKFIPTIINACLTQKPIPIYGNGKNIRDWIYVDDHCEAIISVLEQGALGETYNIAADNQFTNNDLVNEICKLMDANHPAHFKYASLIQYVTDRPGHDLRYALDTKKIQLAFNWQPKTGLQEGLRQTIQYYKKLQDKCSLSII